MPIQRLGIANPAANTDTQLVAFSDNHLVSVVVANKATLATPLTKVTIWVVPNNATVEAQYAYICTNLTVSVGQSFETFRFAVNSGDTLFVRSSVGTTSFSCTGAPQEDSALPENIAQTFTNKVIRGIDNTVYLDKGETAERLASAETGYVRFNTETDYLELLTSTGWESLASRPKVAASPYAPATSANWDTSPTTIAQALDELAARLRALE